MASKLLIPKRPQQPHPHFSLPRRTDGVTPEPIGILITKLAILTKCTVVCQVDEM